MAKILFRSTNRKAPLVGFKEALLRGQAPDYGLYMPVEIPKLAEEEIESFKNKLEIIAAAMNTLQFLLGKRFC